MGYMHAFTALNQILFSGRFAARAELSASSTV
jgi:hypothetical protein